VWADVQRDPLVGIRAHRRAPSAGAPRPCRGRVRHGGPTWGPGRRGRAAWAGAWVTRTAAFAGRCGVLNGRGFAHPKRGVRETRCCARERCLADRAGNVYAADEDWWDHLFNEKYVAIQGPQPTATPTPSMLAGSDRVPPLIAESFRWSGDDAPGGQREHPPCRGDLRWGRPRVPGRGGRRAPRVRRGC
jgi:hypothetical protein